jgi:hypothetical protein
MVVNEFDKTIRVKSRRWFAMLGPFRVESGAERPKFGLGRLETRLSEGKNVGKVGVTDPACREKKE